jgi:heme-degrading monooxygenase HmoA
MFLIVWAFEARPGREPEFERAYSVDGDWSRLFTRSPEYRGTELLRHAAGRGYLTIDRWTSVAAFESFREQWRSEYETLDRYCEQLTEREALVGRFEAP